MFLGQLVKRWKLYQPSPKLPCAVATTLPSVRSRPVLEESSESLLGPLRKHGSDLASCTGRTSNTILLVDSGSSSIIANPDTSGSSSLPKANSSIVMPPSLSLRSAPDIYARTSAIARRMPSMGSPCRQLVIRTLTRPWSCISTFRSMAAVDGSGSPPTRRAPIRF